MTSRQPKQRAEQGEAGGLALSIGPVQLGDIIEQVAEGIRHTMLKGSAGSCP
jgi:hypothetical protein